MSDPDKSFFSGLHLAITGTAALITSVVAVLGLALNQGWLGGGHSNSASTATATTATTAGAGTASGDTSSTVFGAPSLPGGGASGTTPSFSVDPPKLVFRPLAPSDATITVRNDGTAPMTVLPPGLTGPDQPQFSVTDLGCAGSLDPGRTCQIRVTFHHAAGNFSANVVVQVAGAPQAVEVPVQASAIL